MRFAVRFFIWVSVIAALAFIARPLGVIALVLGVLWLVVVEPYQQRRGQRRMWEQRFPHERQR